MKLVIASLVIASYFCVVHATFCSRPPAIQNGYHNGGSWSSFRLGYVIRYSCNSGYQLRGSATTTCSFNSRTWSHYWSNSAPSCIRDSDDDDDDESSSSDSRCPRLSHPSDGKVWYFSTRPGSIAKYTCNTGYTLIGDIYRKCLSSGEWRGTAPTCKRPLCPQLSDPANGRIKSATNGKNVGSVVWFRCNDGFQLVGSESIRCQSNFQWSEKAPTCQPNLCPGLRNPDNGRVKFSSAGRRVGAKVWYVCNDGFRLVGSESRTCQSNRKWSPDAPTCQPNLCPSLRNSDNGRVKFSSAGRRVGAKVWYVCNDGFRLVGSESRTCQSNRKWSPDAPTCQPNLCPSLTNPDNGRVKFSSAGRRVGAKVWYVCNEGFRLVGSESRHCQSNRKWSSSAPTCEPKLCPRLENPENGQVKFSDDGREIGAEVWYICNKGFKLVGSESRRCQSNLKWSSKPPTCQPICERLMNPRNGHVIHNGTDIYALAKYFCDEAFYLVGDRFRRCVESGWTGKTPVCKPIICRQLERLDNGKITLSNSTNVGSKATHICFRGFKLSGNKRRVCDINGNWTGSPPTCVRKYRRRG